MPLMLLLIAPGSATQNVLTATTPSGVNVAGRSQRDIDHATAFVEKGIHKDLVVGVIVVDSLVVVMLTKEMAESIKQDRGQAETLLTSWLHAWRNLTGHKAVTVQLEVEHTEIAKAEVTILGVDRITFK